jgi:ABC-2 type transport system ATP-binding protein
MLELQNLTKTYAKSGAKAVSDLSLDVPEGQIFGFLGPNGAGKTTTIKMMVGIVRPDSGKALIDGKDVQGEPLAAKSRFSYVPDSPDLFVRLKAHEYLNFIADAYGVGAADRRERVSRYAKLLKIDDVLGGRISSFSHGMRQKLVLVGSLLPDPGNWILDEPLVGLDPEAAYVLKDLMRERANAGKTVFFSTHVMEVAEKLCTRLAIIAKGSVVFHGRLEELKEKNGKDRSLEQLFLELVDSDVAGRGL